MLIDMRGTGRTTEQIKSAPAGAVFISGAEVGYTRELARVLGRTDIQVYPRMDPNHYGLKGLDVPVVLDHFITNPD